MTLTKSKATCLGWVLLLGLSLLAAPQASFAAGDDILVTDPDELEEMGFPRDAENIYLAPDADLDGADIQGFSASAADAKAVTGGFYTAWAKQFAGRGNRSTAAWFYSGDLELSRAGGGEDFAEAQITGLPDGAVFFLMDTWFRDAVPTADGAVFLFQACQPRFETGPIVTTLLSSTTTSGFDGPGFRRAGISSATVNNAECVYFLRVRFVVSSTDLALQKIRVSYIVPASP